MSLNSSIVILRKGGVNFGGNDNKNYPWLLSKKKINCLVYCQSDGNVIRNNGVSSILTKIPAVVNADPGTALLDTENLVLAPNGNGPDLVSYKGSHNGSVMGMNDDGIGIVNVLKGKVFFVTGATGFLGKGTYPFLIYFYFINFVCMEFLIQLLCEQIRHDNFNLFVHRVLIQSLCLVFVGYARIMFYLSPDKLTLAKKTS